MTRPSSRVPRPLALRTAEAIAGTWTAVATAEEAGAVSSEGPSLGKDLITFGPNAALAEAAAATSCSAPGDTAVTAPAYTLDCQPGECATRDTAAVTTGHTAGSKAR